MPDAATETVGAVAPTMRDGDHVEIHPTIASA
jgi:hypothetical protein